MGHRSGTRWAPILAPSMQVHPGDLGEGWQGWELIPDTGTGRWTGAAGASNLSNVNRNGECDTLIFCLLAVGP